MKRFLSAIVLASLFAGGVAMAADVVGERLAAYRAQGAGGFSAAAGEAFWNKTFPDPKGGKPRGCTTCHTNNLSKPGRHVETDKLIEPMKPAVNPKRLTDARHIEKWFRRNCKLILGRECTPQEKGDVLLFIRK